MSAAATIPRKKAHATLIGEARRFLRWRKAHGGKVARLENQSFHHQAVNRGKSRDFMELDVLFARNEREGRLA